MTEDELFAGITDALTLSGWRWIHTIRSDGVCQGTGARGFPDLFAVHPTRSQVIAWELKGDDGRPTSDQWAWIGPLAVTSTLLVELAGFSMHTENAPVRFDARIVFPADYDHALDFVLGRIDRFPAAAA